MMRNGGVVPGGPEWWRAGDAWQWCWRNGHIGFGRRQKTAAGNIIYYRRHATGLSLAMESEPCIAGGRGVSDAAATRDRRQEADTVTTGPESFISLTSCDLELKPASSAPAIGGVCVSRCRSAQDKGWVPHRTQVHVWQSSGGGAGGEGRAVLQ